MKKLLKTFLVAAVSAAVASCGIDSPEQGGIKGVLVLNNGNWNSNDASITVYDTDGKTALGGQFLATNGQQLGDLGQDILVVGDRMYISMNGSKVIWVTDMELNLMGMVKVKVGKDSLDMAPRYLAEANGKVYVTYYEGYLGEITPSNLSVRLTPVGSYPEGLCIAGGKAYVANSGYGFGNTISVVDLVRFEEEKKITVNFNPQYVVADPSATSLYVCSWDAYDPVTYDVVSASRLQRVDLKRETVVDMDEYSDVKCIVAGPEDNMLVATGGYDEAWRVCGNIQSLDLATGQPDGKFSAEGIVNYYSLSCSGGYVFVGTSDYRTSGDVLFFDKHGSLLDEFDSKGLNPQKGLYLQ